MSDLMVLIGNFKKVRSLQPMSSRFTNDWINQPTLILRFQAQMKNYLYNMSEISHFDLLQECPLLKLQVISDPRLNGKKFNEKNIVCLERKWKNCKSAEALELFW